MSKIFYTSDLHFGHKAIMRYDDRPFTSVEEMDETIIKNWNNTVSAVDTVYVLGDISWYKADKTIDIFKRLNGHKILIKGNHDKFSYENYKTMGFEQVCDYKEIKDRGRNVVLCHYPIPCFNKRFYGAYMLYGHVHNSFEWNYMKSLRRDFEAIDTRCNIFNVGTMCWDYTPVTLDKIIENDEFYKSAA